MERRSSIISELAKTQRRRSAITLIVPGEEANTFKKDTANASNEEHRTFESFKAKPRCPTPELNNAAYEGEHVNGLPTGAAVMMPHLNGNNIMRANSDVLQHIMPRNGGPAPMPQGGGAPALLRQVPPSHQQQQQKPNHALRGAVANRPTDMHVFPPAPPFTEASRQKVGGRRAINPVIAASASSHQPPLGVTATKEDNTTLRHSAPVSGVGDSRRPLASNAMAFKNSLVLSSDKIPRRTSLRVSSSNRLQLGTAAASGAAGGVSNNSDSGAASLTSTPTVASAASKLQNPAAAAIGIHGSAGYPSSPQPLSAPLPQPSAMQTSAAQRQSLAVSYTKMPSSATDSSQEDSQGATHSSLGRRSTLPQPRVQHEIDLTRVPRPPVRCPQHQRLAVSSRNGMREADSRGKSDRLSFPVSSHSISERGSSGDSSSNLGSVEDSKSSSTTCDLSVVIIDSELASAVSLASAIPASALSRQRCESPPADLTDILASGMAVPIASVPGKKPTVGSPSASPLTAGRAADGDRSSNVRKREEKDRDSATFSEDSVDLLSTTDFSVLMESPGFVAAPSEGQRRLATLSSRPLHLNSGSETVDRILEKPSDASISSFGLLSNDDNCACNNVAPSASTTKVAPASPSSPKLTQVKERARRRRDSTVRLPSPVDLNSLVLWKESEWSILSPLMSCKRHADVASPAGTTKNASSTGNSENCAYGEEGGTGNVAADLRSGSALQDAVSKPNTSVSTCRPIRLSHTGDTKPHLGAFRTGSRGLACSPHAQAVRAASAAAASLTAVNKERWCVTQSLSIDTDLFSFSQLPQEKHGSMVAKLRNMFESNREKCLRTSSSQEGSSIATPSLKDKGISKSSPPRKTEGVSRKALPASEKGVRGINQMQISPQCQVPLPVVPAVAYCSFSHLFSPSSTPVRTEKGELGPLTNTIKSDSLSGTSRQDSGTDFGCTVAGSLASPSPMIRRATMEPQHEVSSVKDSSGASPSISLQRSDPGFSLACFKVSNISSDTVNMFECCDL
ncbi:hypothetical protein, unknown function [Leishmania braziliensis MHOM/BR/75/M2904]|uniref:Uncharacterized protein n=2 Tax=Leishmania braziliensis TaxID=5660 RepID=A4HJJ6_LEIBR|nr:hypothetical protein, unknown function [Leishmania braziliensis MHOM/BR/75/M2904]KAI5687962.1 hypothetical protein MNV84_06335 [Leishmania braziliensis]CAJ2478028.1 unnamed protein product [Leishmania braziliensis]CAM42660.1 hypothetical protein, unknown function [Leishmania braziliensis MHOM/BR/75/M2904]SYZ68406.1 hypothetical_protein [Leishmania braziliensis MHOM/BR/75/M2904]